MNPGGTLVMYGANGVPQAGGISWTTLGAPAGPQTSGAAVPTIFNAKGNQVLQLTADVTKGPDLGSPATG